MITKLLDEKLSVFATKTEIDVLISGFQEIQKENQVLKNKLETTRGENVRVASRWAILEDRAKRNNLVFRGLKFDLKEDCQKVVGDFSKNVLKFEGNVEIN